MKKTTHLCKGFLQKKARLTYRLLPVLLSFSAFTVKAQCDTSEKIPPVITPISNVKIYLGASGAKTITATDVAVVTDNCNPHPQTMVIPSLLTLADTGYKTVTVRATDGIFGGFIPSSVSFNQPHGIAIDAAGNIYIADLGNQRIRKISAAGVVSTLTGNGTSDGTAKGFFNPIGVATDAAGNIYVADQGNNRIRKISTSGAITTLAGGAQGYLDGVGTAARFNHPYGVATDAAGNIYVADTDNHRIRKISPDGTVTTIAGTGVAGFANGNTGNAAFNAPTGIVTDASGNLFIADNGNNMIRKISGGMVTTIAGSGNFGFADGNAANASFKGPFGLCLDAQGNILVADNGNNVIRKIANGVVSTIAGSGESGSTDAWGTDASFATPLSVAVDATGNIYVADNLNNKIRKIDANGSVTTFAGNGDAGYIDGNAYAVPYGNESSMQVQVQVIAAALPVITPKTANLQVSLGANGNVILDANSLADIFSDNGIASVSVSPSSFSCSDLGVQTVTITAVDNTGGQTSLQVQVVVKDNSAPVITPLSGNIIIGLDGSGSNSLSVASVATIRDNCSSAPVITVTPTSFSCADIGLKYVTVTATDASGNASSLQIPVTVKDIQAPLISAPANRVIACGQPTSPSATGTASAFDNCTAASQINITYSDVSTQTATGTGNCNYVITRTWKATDASGNSSTAVQKITVCQLSVSLGQNLYILYGALGYTGCRTLTPSVSGGTAPYTYSWSSDDPQVNGSAGSSVTACHTTDGVYNYTVTVTGTNGCSASASVTLRFINISCSDNSNNQKVTVCFRPSGNPNNCHTICVSSNAVDALLKDGSYLGTCLSDCSVPGIASAFVIAPADDAPAKKFDAKVLNNPSSNNFSIQITTATDEKVSIRITDMHGRVIESRQGLTATGNIIIGDHYAKGVYVAEVMQGADRKVMKLVKQ